MGPQIQTQLGEALRVVRGQRSVAQRVPLPRGVLDVQLRVEGAPLVRRVPQVAPQRVRRVWAVRGQARAEEARGGTARPRGLWASSVTQSPVLRCSDALAAVADDAQHVRDRQAVPALRARDPLVPPQRPCRAPVAFEVEKNSRASAASGKHAVLPPCAVETTGTSTRRPPHGCSIVCDMSLHPSHTDEMFTLLGQPNYFVLRLE
jgi:hypothetical protein